MKYNSEVKFVNKNEPLPEIKITSEEDEETKVEVKKKPSHR